MAKHKSSNRAVRDLLIPADVLVGFGYLAFASTVFVLGPSSVLVRGLVVLPLLLFVPGYSITAAFFCVQPDSSTLDVLSFSGRATAGSVTLAERLVVSFGANLALLPLVGLCLSVIGVGISAASVQTTLVLLSGCGFGIATVRRRQLPPSERFALPFGRWIESVRTATADVDSRRVAALNLVLVAVMVLVTGLLLYGLLAPTSGEAYTDFAILTKNGSDGYVAAGYPENMTVGESATLVAMVENNERRRTNYTVVSQLQRVERANGRLRVMERSELSRSSRSVPPGRTWRISHPVTPDMTGENLRLTYLLYKGAPPAEPTIDSAYQHTYLWLSVRDGSTERPETG